MSTANEPDPVSTANEPEGGGLRLTITRGGDPGPEVLAALATILTRPVSVAPVEDADEEEQVDVQTRWVRAARLEGVVHGRRITTIADLAWRRAPR